MKEFVIKCGTFLDGSGHPVEHNVTLLVKGGHIARVERGESDLDRYPRQLDASDGTVMPGLIDAHKHIINCGGSGVGVGLDLAQVKLNLEGMYQGGVTSVLDLGSAELLHLLPQVPVKQPRVFYALTILTCDGGYPAEYMKPEFYRMGAAKECRTRQDIRRHVKKLFGLGVSVIKTAVVSRTFEGRPQVCWTDDMLKALTDEAHGYGLNVCAHITYASDYAQAVRCGVDSVHHAAFDGLVPEPVMDAMIARGIIFVPTLSLIDLMILGLEECWIDDPGYRPAVNEIIRRNMHSFTRAYHEAEASAPIGDLFIRLSKRDLQKVPHRQLQNVMEFIRRGGIVALGTDSALGFSLHTTPVRELELLVRAGLTLPEAIKAATSGAAAVFNKEGEIGTLKAGKKADILILNGTLDKDFEPLYHIRNVILDGNIIHRKASQSA